MAIAIEQTKTIKTRIVDFIKRDILFVEGPLPFGEDDSFLENGLIDSTGILELQLFVEEAFGIEVRDEDIVPENFDSLSRLVAYVERKRGGG